MIKLYSNSTPFKCELEASSVTNDCIADLSAYINLNSTLITTDISDNDTKFDFEYYIVVTGLIYKSTTIDIVDDLYSLDGEVEVVSNNYTLSKKEDSFKLIENIDTEITLADELNVDEILGMVNTSANITQYLIKDNSIVIEGVINGNLIYFDENKQINHLTMQLPYSINTKQDFKKQISALHLTPIPMNCKCKIKRGNILVLDCEICITATPYTQNEIKLINNVKLGKVVNYDDIALQIYIARPNESSWDLCKRLHVTPEQLVQYNKENPATYLGGEKVVIYR